MLNFDMANDPIGFSTTRPEMKKYFSAWGQQISAIDSGFENKFNSGAGLHSDHQPFMLAGLPIAGTLGNLPKNAGQYYHSDGDVFRLIDKRGMTNLVRYASMLTYALGNTKNIAVERFTDTQNKAFLEKHQLKEALKIAGEWPWED